MIQNIVHVDHDSIVTVATQVSVATALGDK